MQKLARLAIVAAAVMMPAALSASTMTLKFQSNLGGTTPITYTDSSGHEIIVTDPLQATKPLSFGGFKITADAVGAPELGGLELGDLNAMIRNTSNKWLTLTITMTQSGLTNITAPFGLNHAVGGTSTGTGIFTVKLNGNTVDIFTFSPSSINHVFSNSDTNLFANTGNNPSGYTLTEIAQVTLAPGGVASFDQETWDPPTVPEPASLSMLGLGVLAFGGTLRRRFSL